jgi:hypothetical protein
MDREEDRDVSFSTMLERTAERGSASAAAWRRL